MFKENKKGLAMVEVLFSIAIIMLASIIFANVVQNTFKTSQNSRDFLIAQNLSEEAANSLEIILNTNEIILAPPENAFEAAGLLVNAARCWSHQNPNAESMEIHANCPANDPNLLTANDTYIPWFNLEEGRWRLFEIENKSLDLDLRIEDSDEIDDLVIFKVYENQDPNVPFAYFNAPQNPEGLPDDKPLDGVETKFYRAIEIIEVEDSHIMAQVDVQWLSEGRVFKIETPLLFRNPFN